MSFRVNGTNRLYDVHSSRVLSEKELRSGEIKEIEEIHWGLPTLKGYIAFGDLNTVRECNRGGLVVLLKGVEEPEFIDHQNLTLGELLKELKVNPENLDKAIGTPVTYFRKDPQAYPSKIEQVIPYDRVA